MLYGISVPFLEDYEVVPQLSLKKLNFMVVVSSECIIYIILPSALGKLSLPVLRRRELGRIGN